MRYDRYKCDWCELCTEDTHLAPIDWLHLDFVLKPEKENGNDLERHDFCSPRCLLSYLERWALNNDFAEALDIGGIGNAPPLGRAVVLKGDEHSRVKTELVVMTRRMLDQLLKESVS